MLICVGEMKAFFQLGGVVKVGGLSSAPLSPDWVVMETFPEIHEWTGESLRRERLEFGEGGLRAPSHGNFPSIANSEGPRLGFA